LAAVSSAAARSPACHAFWLTELARAVVAFLASKVAAASSFPSLAIVFTYPAHVALSAFSVDATVSTGLHGALPLALVAAATFALAAAAFFVSEVSIALTADSDLLIARVRVCPV